MIKPTIGRVVWFQPAKQADQPLRAQPYPALICFVHSDTLINVGFFNENGTAGSACSVQLVQEGDTANPSGYFAEWMPYQVGQAKKQDSAIAADSMPKAATSDQAIEAEIIAKGKTAPRITPDHIQATIKAVHYFTAQQGAEKAARDNGSYMAGEPSEGVALGLLTFCVLVLQNGFTVTGESACASPENFDAEIGRKIARQNAEQKIWALEGYVLKQRLFEAGNTPPALGSDLPPHQQRVVEEKVELDAKGAKLNAFFDAPIFAGLDAAEQHRLRTQLVAMQTYSEILGERIAAFPAPVAHQPV